MRHTHDVMNRSIYWSYHLCLTPTKLLDIFHEVVRLQGREPSQLCIDEAEFDMTFLQCQPLHFYFSINMHLPLLPSPPFPYPFSLTPSFGLSQSQHLPLFITNNPVHPFSHGASILTTT